MRVDTGVASLPLLRPPVVLSLPPWCSHSTMSSPRMPFWRRLRRTFTKTWPTAATLPRPSCRHHGARRRPCWMMPTLIVAATRRSPLLWPSLSFLRRLLVASRPLRPASFRESQTRTVTLARGRWDWKERARKMKCTFSGERAGTQNICFRRHLPNLAVDHHPWTTPQATGHTKKGAFASDQVRKKKSFLQGTLQIHKHSLTWL
jgi:hypothetical protein